MEHAEPSLRPAGSWLPVATGGLSRDEEGIRVCRDQCTGGAELPHHRADLWTVLHPSGVHSYRDSAADCPRPWLVCLGHHRDYQSVRWSVLSLSIDASARVVKPVGSSFIGACGGRVFPQTTGSGLDDDGTGPTRMSVGRERAIIEIFEHPAKDARTTMEKMFD